jgi:signal transduction histidine kinase
MPATPESSLLDVLPDAILRLDAGGGVMFASAAAHALAGGSMKGLAVLLPEQRAVLQHLCQPEALLPAEPLIWPWQPEDKVALRVEHRFRRLADGTLLIVARPVGDLIPRGDLEAERHLLERRAVLAQKFESLGVMAGGLAHDFNNLLTGVLGYVELLRRSQANVTELCYLDQIQQLAGRAADLCQQLLAYAGKGRFYLETIDLNRIVETTLPVLQAAVPGTTHMELLLAPDLPAVQADATQMRQLIVNLTLNGSEALDGQAGTVILRTLHADLDGTDPDWLGDHVPRGRHVIFQVSDPGCGMSPELQPRIFDPFFTTKFPGRGLGLSAVLGIVSGHRGSLKVQSAPGHGTTFTVALPAVAAVPVTAEPITGRTLSATLLVVDDDTSVRNLVARVLDVAGFRYILAESGEGALEQLAGTKVDLVLLDLIMPGMSGEETLTRIHQRWPRLPVLLMSGYTEGVNVAGHVGFLAKPFRPSELLDRVRAVLEGTAPEDVV